MASPNVAQIAALEGRARELDVLSKALASTHQGELSLVLVEGESGLGKSAVVGEFVKHETQRQPLTWVLNGRCYEHDHMPYNALDGCIDELSKALRKLSGEACEKMMPRRVGLVAELFPVLRGVPAVGHASTHGCSVEPAARRQEAFSALAELLANVAEQRPLVLVIEDLQWADEESFRMLRVLLEHRPAPPLLLICTVRPRSELRHEVAAQVDRLRAPSCTQVISLRRLPSSSARALASELLGSQASPALASRIASESMGHPLLIGELVRYAASHHLQTLDTPSLEAALAARVRDLDAPARDLLEAVALCDRPRSEAVFMRVLDQEGALGDTLTRLLTDKLLVRCSSGDLGCFHDAIRTAVVEGMPRERAAKLHGALAGALTATGEGHASELAFHWDRAGEAQLALAAYKRAAEQALALLAFAQASQLCARAIELVGASSDADACALLVQHAHALARSGRSADAALLYLRAAKHATLEERVRLRVWAAQHQLQSAQVESGMESARAVLSDLALPLPGANAGSRARLVWERTRLAVRGLNTREKGPIATEDKLALDAMAGLILPVTWAEPLPGAALHLHHLRCALETGEPRHVARALSQEAAFRASERPDQASNYRPLFERSLRLAAGDPAAEAHVLLMEATADLCCAEFASAEKKLESAHTLIVHRCPGEPWLLTSVRANLSCAWFYLGEHARIASDAQTWMADASERNDAFALAALLGQGFGFVTSLMADGPQTATERVTRAMEAWPPKPFGFAHHSELVARAHIASYAGSPAGQRWLSERAGIHDRAFPYATRGLRDMLVFQRCLSALASPDSAPRELGLAERQALRLGRGGGLGALLRPLVLAQVRALRGERDTAKQLLSEAREGFQRCAMAPFANAASYLTGVLEGGADGREKCDAAMGYFRERGWKDPWRAVTMLVPAARTLETGETRASDSSASLIHDRYRPGRTLDRRGFGVVIEALDTRTGRTVALKSLAAASPTDLSRLKQEFRALQGVHHVNLVRLEALIEHDSTWTVAMEHVEGVDFLAFVRPEDCLDVERLRSALSGLLRGVQALHEAGFVHRDINPKNVLVTQEGRVVLVDFGLMTPIDVRERDTTEAAVGSVSYVAPEQVDSPNFDASADVYAIGTCLYVALTGQLPFDHFTTARVLDAKRRGRPVPPWALRIEVPTDLEELCLAMLERVPAQRPTVARALSWLETRERSARTAAPRLPSGEREASFAGRAVELNELAGLFARAIEGQCVFALLQGEGGVGKTALMQEALRKLREATPSVLCLRSRCYANEQMPYQVFDAAVDELARELRRLPRAEAEALLPPKAALLAQLFPVLGSVTAIGEATKKGIPAEPAVRRREALSAFVGLLVNVGRSTPLVVAIDDIQWADAESFHLLKLLHREAAGARLAIVATRRRGEARDKAAEAELEALPSAVGAIQLTLPRLSPSDATALLCSLLGSQASPDRVAAMVREGGGHPLLLRELSAYASEGDGSPRAGDFDLDQALGARCERLPREARSLLNLVALASRPYAVSVFERACGTQLQFEDAARLLLGQELLSKRGARELACSHDRVRELVTRLIAPDRRRELSGRLAEALENEPGSDAGERARLWDDAQQPEKAASAYAEAGAAALEAFAFATADKLYARALELKGELRDPEYLRFLVERAHALARAGKSAEAAALYTCAAEQAQGDQRVRLRVWATQHQIQSAQIAEGMANARAVLTELGLPLPRGSKGSLARIAWERARVSLGKVDMTRKSSEIAAKDRLALDTMAGLILPVTWAELLPGAALNAHHLRRAMVVGEPRHLARALSHEAMFRAMQDPDAAATYMPLLEQSRKLSALASDPATEAYVLAMQAAAHQMRSEFAPAVESLAAAHELIVDRCPGEQWLLTSIRMNLGRAWFSLGEHGRLLRESEPWRQDAMERADAFALAALVGAGHGFAGPLMNDQPDHAAERVAQAMLAWPPESFGFAHAGEIIARACIAAYRGTSEGWEWLLARTNEHDGAFPHRTRRMRDSLSFHRCLAGLAAHGHASKAAGDALLRAIEHQQRRIHRSQLLFGAAAVSLIAAQVATLRGDRAKAQTLAGQARESFTALSMSPYAHSAAYLEGALEGGERGRLLRQSALDFYREGGWREPWRAVTMFVPAARTLEHSGATLSL